MTKTRVAKIYSFILALTLVFACFSPSTYALSKQQFGAWVAAALQAINITAQATATGAADASRDLMDWLSYPTKVVASQFVDVPYTTPIDTIDTYLSRSTLQIDKDKVTIDGVEYTDIWLSNEASEKFRVNAFDLENAFDIVSQSEGTFASGVGSWGNVPIFRLGTGYQSQYYEYYPGNYNIGDTSVNLVLDSSNRPNLTWTTERGNTLGYNSNSYDVEYGPFKSYVYVQNFPSTAQQTVGILNTSFSNEYGTYTFNQQGLEDVDVTPFDFDWVSGTIPADEVLPSDEGLRIRVPTEDIADWYTDYPGTADSTVIDMGDPDLEAKVEDLIDLIIPLIPVLDIDFTTNETPTPDPDPDPDPEPWDDILSGLQDIFDSITIGNTIGQGIKTVAESIASKLDDIKTGIGDLANKIETGSADFFRDIVQSIWQPFLPLFNIFRAGVGIWHYVVEWLQYIHEPFLTFWNFLGSAGYIFLTPIYASAAAAIVIAIYRRFGR